MEVRKVVACSGGTTARKVQARKGDTGLLLSTGDFVTSSAASVELAKFACCLTQAGYRK